MFRKREIGVKVSLLIFLATLAVTSTGCVYTRGIMYLNPEKVGTYLSKEEKPEKLLNEDKILVEEAVEEARKLLRKIPDGNRILGGFCTDPEIRKEILSIQDYSSSCRKRLEHYQNKGNLYTAIHWGIAGGAAATGLGMIIGGLIPAKGETRAGLILGFGIPMLTFALVDAFAPFARWSSQYSKKATYLDNYIWTLRRRISVEVCTARDRSIALFRLKKIKKQVDILCKGSPKEAEYKLTDY